MHKYMYNASLSILSFYLDFSIFYLPVIILGKYSYNIDFNYGDARERQTDRRSRERTRYNQR